MYEMTTDDCPKGTSLALDGDSDLEEVPKSHRHLLSEDIQAVFHNPLGYVAELATKSKSPGLTRLLKRFSECEDEWQLELHHLDANAHPYIPTEVSSVFLRFFLEDLDIAPGMILHPEARLSVEDRLREGLHPALGHLYSLIDGTNETGFLRGGGLFEAASITSLADCGVGYDDEAIDGSQFFYFACTYDGGSFLAGLDGEIHLMSCGGDCLHSVGGADTWLEAYCDAQLKGKDITDLFEDQMRQR